MRISLIEEQAITARMAMVVGAEEFDRLFLGIQFGEVEGNILYAYCPDPESAEEIEERFSLHISIIASEILKKTVGIVMVLPRVTH
ncbi:hypothetical protein CSIRO_3089 [Bradyrhizobiaceae bacterium SG-6C]|nr:hypothetical protein CSIRO_3089 [Bradyrhizobiaceae bacterium SG-6C]